MFQRAHLHSLITRIREPRRFIQVIMGPRQVGKTTLVTQLIEKTKLGAHFVSADAISGTNTSWLQQQWETSRLMMDQQNDGAFVLIIDEIQKIDNWSETVKSLWDADTRNKRDLKVILLGSSRMLLQQGLTESLAGRFEIIYMGHWSFEEMQQAFGWSVNEYVWFGGYPGSAALIQDETRWKKYVKESLIETSISKDILMLTRVDKPALMKQLFEVGCLYSGQILSYNKMLGQFLDAGNTTTLAHYLQLLDTAGLIAGLEKYSGNTIRKKSSSPKFQVYNTALISSQQSETLQEILKKPDEWGRMVESAIGAHLLNASLAADFSFNYWREGNDEVDFVIAQKKLVAIEVKSGTKRSSAGMAVFQKKFGPDKMLLIGGDGLPWQQLLKMDPVELFK